MDTKQFLETILPRQGVYFAVAIRDDGRTAHVPCHSIDEMAATIARINGGGVATYHACASYKNPPYFDEQRNRKVCRVRENWAYARSLWIDLDVGEKKAAEGKGYATQRDAIVAFATFCNNMGLPKPLLVSSGYGVHAYFVTDRDMEPSEWVPMAESLKQLLVKAGVLADPSRTADFASVLRPVGTQNRKNGLSKDVKVILDAPACSADKLKEIINSKFSEHVGGLPAVPAYLAAVTQDVNAIPATDFPDFEYDADAIASGCKQVALVRDSQGDASYEHWRAVIGLLTFCKDGLDTAHKWSERRAETGHTSLDVDTRFNTWDSGPTTCAYFAGCNPDGCEGCAHKGNFNTPLVLGRVEPEASPVVTPEETPAPAPVVEEGPYIPDGYKWSGQQMVHYVKNKDGILEAHSFSNTFFYLEQAIINEEGFYEYVAVRHHPMTHRKMKFRISGEAIGVGGNSLLKELGRHSLLLTNNKDALAHMTAYLREAVHGILQRVETVRTTTNYGWQTDDSFVIGERQYLKDGSISKVLLAGAAKEKATAFKEPTGNLDEFVRAMNWLYARKGMEPLQYVIASMWGSLLSPFCDSVYHGIPCVLTGASSGKGKTTCAMVGLSTFGDPMQMMIASKNGATQNAMTRILGAFQNLPILFDEMTNISPQALSALAYALATGTDRARLQAAGGAVKFAHQETWSSQSVITGNSHMTAQLTTNGNSEAEAMRLFEIRIDKYNIPTLQPLEVSEYVNVVMKHAGTAGHEFIKYLVTHRAEVEDRVQNYAKKEEFPNELVVESKYRFYRYHICCTMVAAEIMSELGICQFDINNLRDFAMRAVQDLCQEVKDNAPTGTDLLAQLLEHLDEHTIETTMFTAKRNTYHVGDFPKFRPPLLARRIVGSDSSIDPVYNNTVLVYSHAIKDWLKENRGMDADVLAKDLTEAGVLVGQDRLYLSKGCIGFGSVQNWTWVIDLTKLAPELLED